MGRWRIVQRVTTVLAILDLVVMSSEASLLFATMVRCADNSSVLHFRAGEPIDLCCYKTKGGCDLDLHIYREKPHAEDPNDLDPDETENGDDDYLSDDGHSYLYEDVDDYDNDADYYYYDDDEYDDDDTLMEEASSSRGDNDSKEVDDRYRSSSDGSSCFVSLSVKNSTAADSGLYTCAAGGEALFKNDVFVIEAPLQPTVTAVTCCSKGELVVAFDRGPPNGEYFDYYNVTLTKHGSEIVLCPPRSGVTCDEAQCWCKRTFSKDDPNAIIPGSVEVTVSVTVLRSVQSVTATKRLNLIDAYKPESLKEVHVGKVDAHVAELSFNLSERMMDLYQYETHSGQALWFFVVLEKLQGHPEQLTMVARAVQEGDSYTRHTLEQIKIALTGLVPYTRYLASVTAFGPGGASEATCREFITKPAAPLHAPRHHLLTAFPSASDNDVDYLEPLLLQWEALSDDDQGGPNLMYQVSIHTNQPNQPTIYQTSTTAASVLLKRLPRREQLRARIWASNDLGPSREVTDVDIPLNIPLGAPRDSEKIPASKVSFFVEYLNEFQSAVLLGNLPKGGNVEEVAVHWCADAWIDKKDGLTKCLDFPRTSTFRLESGAPIFNVTLHFDEIQSENQTQAVTVRHVKAQYDLRSTLDRVETFTHTLEASVSSSTRALMNTHNSEGMHNSESSARTPNSESYTKTNNSETSMMKIHNSESSAKTHNSGASESMPSSTDHGITDDVGASEDVEYLNYPFVMFSALVNGRWTVSVPADCLFNRESDTAQLTISESSNSPSSLEVQQECRQKDPLPFLPAVIQAWTSPNKDCSRSTGQGHVSQYSNPIFQPITVAKPTSGTTFFCVNAHSFPRDNASVAVSLPNSRIMNAVDDDSTKTMVIMGLSIPIVLLVSLAVGVCCCKFCRRGKVLRKETNHGLLELGCEPEKTFTEGQVLYVPTPPASLTETVLSARLSQADVQQSSVTDTDSGRATGTSNSWGTSQTDEEGRQLTPSSSDELVSTDLDVRDSRTSGSGLTSSACLSNHGPRSVEMDDDDDDDDEEEEEEEDSFIEHGEQMKALKAFQCEFF